LFTTKKNNIEDPDSSGINYKSHGELSAAFGRNQKTPNQ
jgi:hypothetical protein